MFSLIRCDNAIIPRFTVFANGWTPIFAESLQGEQRLLCRGSLLDTWMFLKLGEVFKNACGVRLSFTQYTEIYRDEARHGKAFEGLLKRYFN